MEGATGSVYGDRWCEVATDICWVKVQVLGPFTFETGVIIHGYWIRRERECVCESMTVSQ